MFSTRTNWNRSTNRLTETLARLQSSDREVLDLTASNPTECGFRYDGASILKSLIHPSILQYQPDPRGLRSAREAVSAYYSARDLRVSPDDLLLTTSTSEAYSYAFRLLCNPGDEILIPTPSYPLFDFLADLQDVKLVRYPLFYDHGWHIDFHALEQLITPTTRGIIVVHPNNPTGHYTRPKEMERLAQICAFKKLAIIADEVFLDFSRSTGASQRSFVANGHAALTFTMSGVSKISALPQMKMAWLAVNGPKDLKREALARLEIIADTYLSMNAPIQLAAPVLLAQRHAMQQQIMTRVEQNLATLDSQLSDQRACSRLEMEGGWYAVLRVPATRSDEEIALELLESEGVFVHPGHFYDFPGDGHMIVSLITRERDFNEGIERLLAAFQ
ncbi:MAG TPA: pyridoxal phosphate-dependent aminotransferase [Candidatus Angelobacter sp.]|nr:pyridoxal phosphate-dependent aminotransferase [Candidatus Angelobacter sp.]